MWTSGDQAGGARRPSQTQKAAFRQTAGGESRRRKNKMGRDARGESQRSVRRQLQLVVKGHTEPALRFQLFRDTRPNRIGIHGSTTRLMLMMSSTIVESRTCPPRQLKEMGIADARYHSDRKQSRTANEEIAMQRQQAQRARRVIRKLCHAHRDDEHSIECSRHPKSKPGAVGYFMPKSYALSCVTDQAGGHDAC